MWGTAGWDDLIPDCDQAMEVFAAYGLAAFESAGLEESIVLLLAIEAMVSGADRGSDEMRELMNTRRRKTLGQLLSEAKATQLMPDEVIDRFSEALVDRNWLIHRFHRELIPEVVDPVRLASLVARLRGMREQFVQTGSLAHSLIEDRLTQQNVDIAELESETHSLLRRIQEGWPVV
jgi:hypothetical protein